MSRLYEVTEEADPRYDGSDAWTFSFTFDMDGAVRHVDAVKLMRERVSIAEWCVENIPNIAWLMGDDVDGEKLTIIIRDKTYAAAFRLRWY